MSLRWYAFLCGFRYDVLFTKDHLRSISFFYKNAHHDWLTKEYISNWFVVSVCPSIRFVMLGAIELKVSMGVGDGPTKFVGIFLKRPHLGSKVIQGSICLRKVLWLPNLVRRTPDQSVAHCWGQRSCRGHVGSTRGQIAYECPMVTKFGGKNHWPRRNALLGSTDM